MAELNDPLHLRSFGVKKDYATKEERIRAAYEEQNRNYYPKDKQGVFDEWSALVRQREEQHREMERQRKEQKRLEQGKLSQELGVINQVRIDERQRDLEAKKVELSEMEQKRAEHEEFQRHLRDEDKEFKRYMADNYSSTVRAAKDRERVVAEQELLEDKFKLNVIERDIQNEKLRNYQQRNDFNKQQQELLNYRGHMKRLEDEQKAREREEYNKMCEENARREINKERQYKQFFYDFDRNMQDRMQQHVQTVLNPEIDKITNV